MFDHKWASFSAYDADQSNVVVKYENGDREKIDCSVTVELGGPEKLYKSNTSFNALIWQLDVLQQKC